MSLADESPSNGLIGGFSKFGYLGLGLRFRVEEFAWQNSLCYTCFLSLSASLFQRVAWDQPRIQ